MIFVNFKTYEEGSGAQALELLKTLEEVSMELGIKVIPVLQASDIREAVSLTKLEIWVQHVDPVGYGAHTGSTIPEAVVEDGAVGTFLNHSEHPFDTFENLQKAVERATQVGLKTLVFAKDLEALTKISALTPTFLAYEPPELVGSTTVSVASAKPEVISQAATIAREHSLPLIVGAGVHSQEDIRKSLELGAVGFAIATNIVKADDPKTALLNLMEGYKG